MIATEASRLDAPLLRAIARWGSGDDSSLSGAAFDELARNLFADQIRLNVPYGRFAAALGFGPRRLPGDWKEIPAAPASAFKDATLATFDVAQAELEFHTSGTTSSRPGKHYMQRALLYDAALLAGFRRFMLADGESLRYLNLVPDPDEHPHSSLGYMMKRAGEVYGSAPPRFYLRAGAVDAEGFRRDLRGAIAAEAPVCIAGTAFAFVALLDALEADADTFGCAAGSRIMETGGFKGRSRTVSPDELHERLSRTFEIPKQHVVAEYGMTELTSQYYDAPSSRLSATRVKAGPPWLRAVVAGPDGRELPPGQTGFLRHVDLANRSSVVAIQTEDLAYAVPSGFVLLGRGAEAPLRGCSLDAEDLIARGR